MPVAVITGAGGLIGSESVAYFAEQGFDVIGLDNDMRSYFFGPEASTAPTMQRLSAEIGPAFRPLDLDIRDAEGIMRLFAEHSPRSSSSCTPPPSRRTTGPPANHTSTSRSMPRAPSTCSKRPATTPRTLRSCSRRRTRSTATGPTSCPCSDLGRRLDLDPDHPWYRGIDISMSIDASTHSLFGVSKAAADLLVQEYGRYFGMPTVCFRGGCLTGPQHAGAQLHGFLAYLMKCTVTGQPYTIFGYEGKQVRDNIHAHDVVRALRRLSRERRARRRSTTWAGAESRTSRCSRRWSCVSTSPAGSSITRYPPIPGSAITAGG